MSKTTENLKTAFAGESQANRKYLAFAKKVEEEGLTQVARLFRAAAEAETIHAHDTFHFNPTFSKISFYLCFLIICEIIEIIK